MTQPILEYSPKAHAHWPPTGSSRLLQLDILRGLAILLVLGRHFVISASDAGFLWPVAGVWQTFGWTGVDLFFVLSGFLVGGLLCAEARDFGKIDVKRFIIRRGFKIWPLYYLYLVSITIASLFHYGIIPYPWPREASGKGLSFEEATSSFWPSFLHIQNYMTVPRGESWWYHPRIWVDAHFPSALGVFDYLHNHMGLPRGHLWSLAVEEHFYLLLPLLMILLLRRKSPLSGSSRIHLIPAISVATMILCTTIRCLTPIPTLIIDGHIIDRYPQFTHIFPTHTRMDGLFFGVLIAYYYHFKSAIPALFARFRWLLLVLGVALISPMMVLSMEKNPWIPQVGFTMLYLGYGCILVSVLSMRVDWMERCAGWRLAISRFLRALGWVGLFSYPIYLWHQDFGKFPVQYMLDAGIFDFTWLKSTLPWIPGSPTAAFTSTLHGLRWLLATGVYLALAIGLSALIGKAIERPVLLLRDRLFPRRAPAVDAVADAPTSAGSPVVHNSQEQLASAAQPI